MLAEWINQKNNSTRASFIWAGVLVVLIWLAYFPILNNGFVRLDDPFYITENNFVTTGLTAQSIAQAWTQIVAGNWHPVTMLSHQLDVTLFGLNPGAHHAMNLILHTANALLLFGVIKRFSGNLLLAMVCSGLWALHPINVEPVAWASSRKDMLSQLFILLTLLTYHRFLLSAKLRDHLLALTFYGVALLSKPTAVSLPILLILLDVWPLGRLSLSRHSLAPPAPADSQASTPASELSPPPGPRTNLARLVMQKWAFIALAIAGSVMTFFVQRSAGAMPDAPTLTFMSKFASAAVAYTHTLGHLFWPSNLCVLYGHPGHWPASTVTLSFGILISITAGAAFLALVKGKPATLVGWAWFIVAMAPMSGVVLVGSAYMADRYAYLPGIGIAMVVGLVWSGFISKPGQTGKLSAALFLIVLMALCALTHRQTYVWQNSTTLFERAVIAQTINPIANVNLGIEYARADRLADAQSQFEAALKYEPNFQAAKLNLGHVYALTNRPVDAAGEYHRLMQQTAANTDDIAQMLINLAADRKQDQARQLFEAIEKLPVESPTGWLSRALLFERLGQLKPAAQAWRKFTESQPENPQGHLRLGLLLARLGLAQEARLALLNAIRLNPSDTTAKTALEQLEKAPPEKQPSGQ